MKTRTLITAFLLLSGAASFTACNPGTSATTEINLADTLESQAAPSNALVRTGWKIISSPKGNDPKVILDGNEKTIWTSSLNQTNTLALQIDLGSMQSFNKIVLEAGPKSQNFLRSYNVYLSSDANSWGPFITSGNGKTGTRLEIDLGARSGRYLTIQNGYDTPGRPWGIAELWLTGTGGGGGGAGGGGTGGGSTGGGTGNFPTSRDASKWPFAQNSIWNVPIGSNARYIDADLGPIGQVIPDLEYIYFSKANDPVQKVFLSNPGVPRVNESQTTSYVSIQIPDDYIVADGYQGYTPNNAAAIIAPDGKTIQELQPFTRPTRGGKVWAFNPTIGANYESTLDIKGPGYFGSHFGSLMSTLGGSIRPGEINGADPIRHAIKLELSTDQLFKDAGNPANSFRWPARNADGDTREYGVFNKSNSALRMGSLLAIAPNVTETSLGLQTAQGKKILKVLQDYGAYIVDTSGGSEYKPNGGYPINIAAESSVVKNEFSFDGSPSQNTAWFNDFKKMMAVIKVVDNNTPGSIGGGGTPRQPLAPPFSN
jgi:hypothetical protein